MHIVEEIAARCAEAEAERGGDAPALVLDFVTTGDAGILGHQVEAQGGGFGQLPVEVGRGAAEIAAAGGDRTVIEVMRDGVLGIEVDGAGGRAAADIGAGGALQDFDGFDIENIA